MLGWMKKHWIVSAFAAMEQLGAHGRSVKIRVG